MKAVGVLTLLSLSFLVGCGSSDKMSEQEFQALSTASQQVSVSLRKIGARQQPCLTLTQDKAYLRCLQPKLKEGAAAIDVYTKAIDQSLVNAHGSCSEKLQVLKNQLNGVHTALIQSSSAKTKDAQIAALKTADLFGLQTTLISLNAACNPHFDE